MMRWTYDHIGEDYIFHCRLETKTHSFEACVLQGGNGLWSAWINCVLLGRRKKRGIGRIAGKSVELRMMRPQAQTREEAIEWAERELETNANNDQMNNPTPEPSQNSLRITSQIIFNLRREGCWPNEDQCKVIAQTIDAFTSAPSTTFEAQRRAEQIERERVTPEPTRAAMPEPETAPTPETDAVELRDRYNSIYTRLLEHARTLERQRDAAIRERDALNRHHDISECPKGHRFRTIASHPAKSEREWECPHCAVQSRDALASQVAGLQENVKMAILHRQESDEKNRSLASQVGALQKALEKIIQDGDGCYSRELAQEALDAIAL